MYLPARKILTVCAATMTHEAKLGSERVNRLVAVRVDLAWWHTSIGLGRFCIDVISMVSVDG